MIPKPMKPYGVSPDILLEQSRFHGTCRRDPGHGIRLRFHVEFEFYTKKEMGADLDAWIEKVRKCEYLPENDLKQLCSMVRKSSLYFE